MNKFNFNTVFCFSLLIPKETSICPETVNVIVPSTHTSQLCFLSGSSQESPELNSRIWIVPEIQKSASTTISTLTIFSILKPTDIIGIISKATVPAISTFNSTDGSFEISSSGDPAIFLEPFTSLISIEPVTETSAEKTNFNENVTSASIPA